MSLKLKTHRRSSIVNRRREFLLYDRRNLRAYRSPPKRKRPRKYYRQLEKRKSVEATSTKLFRIRDEGGREILQAVQLVLRP